MIVCATPRSGATKFASDKAKELNIEYYDEVRPGTTKVFRQSFNNVKWFTGGKGQYHELPYTNHLDMEKFYEVSKDPGNPNYIILANGTNSHWLFDKADWFVARRNLYDWMCSVCNFWLLNRQGNMGVQLMQTYLAFMFENAYVLYDYCTRTNKKIEWYEDMPYARRTPYVWLNKHPEYKEIIRTMDSFIQYTKILDVNKELTYDRGFKEI